MSYDYDPALFTLIIGGLIRSWLSADNACVHIFALKAYTSCKCVFGYVYDSSRNFFYKIRFMC